jgi:hypothetical protein
LRRFKPLATDATLSNWIDYFNRAFVISSLHPQDGVLRYAVAALQSATSTAKNWPLGQALLWQCVALDPGCMRFVVDILLVHRHGTSLTLDSSIGERTLNELIQTSAIVGHGSEVVWCIWATIVLNLSLSNESQSAIAVINDPIVAVAAMKARDLAIIDATFEPTLWSSWFLDDCFEEENWLFVYEATVRHWFPKEVARVQPNKGVVPAHLQSLGISFLNDDVAKNYVPQRLSRSIGGSGGY